MAQNTRKRCNGIALTDSTVGPAVAKTRRTKNQLEHTLRPHTQIIVLSYERHESLGVSLLDGMKQRPRDTVHSREEYETSFRFLEDHHKVYIMTIRQSGSYPRSFRATNLHLGRTLCFFFRINI